MAVRCSLMMLTWDSVLVAFVCCINSWSGSIEACWAQDSANRPSFKELVDRLDVFGRDGEMLFCVSPALVNKEPRFVQIDQHPTADDFPQDMTIFLGRRSIWREEVEQIMERHRTLQIEEDRLSVRAQELEQVPFPKVDMQLERHVFWPLGRLTFLSY